MSSELVARRVHKRSIMHQKAIIYQNNRPFIRQIMVHDVSFMHPTRADTLYLDSIKEMSNVANLADFPSSVADLQR